MAVGGLPLGALRCLRSSPRRGGGAGPAVPRWLLTPSSPTHTQLTPSSHSTHSKLTCLLSAHTTQDLLTCSHAPRSQLTSTHTQPQRKPLPSRVAVTWTAPLAVVAKSGGRHGERHSPPPSGLQPLRERLRDPHPSPFSATRSDAGPRFLDRYESPPPGPAEPWRGPAGTHMGHPSPVDTVKSVSSAQSTLS